MTPSEKIRVQKCVRELAEIFARNTPSDKCQTFEEIKQVVREHLTLQRQVHTKIEHLDFPDSQLAINEVSIDGGKVRLRTEIKGQPSEWRDYKAARLSSIFYGATFRGSEELTAWINAQRLTNPLVCIGDGHSGIWNLFSQIATEEKRQEILDWFHRDVKFI